MRACRTPVHLASGGTPPLRRCYHHACQASYNTKTPPAWGGASAFSACDSAYRPCSPFRPTQHRPPSRKKELRGKRIDPDRAGSHHIILNDVIPLHNSTNSIPTQPTRSPRSFSSGTLDPIRHSERVRHSGPYTKHDSEESRASQAPSPARQDSSLSDSAQHRAVETRSE